MSAISPTVYTGPYTANGTQTEFSFNFSIVSAADIRVEVDSVAISSLLYTVEFSATGGTMTFAAAPAAGARILLLSAPDYLQTSEFENEGAYNLATINTINRRASVKALVTEDKASRALKVPRGEEGLEIPLSDVASIVAVGESLLAGGDIPTVAGAIGDVATVAAGIADVGTVAGIDAQVATVAAISGAITVAAAIDDELVAVANRMSDVTTVANDLNGPNSIGQAVIAAAATAADRVATGADKVSTAADRVQTGLDRAATRLAADAVAAGNIVMYDVGAPDAVTGGPNGATYIESSSARQYGPKKNGVWPSRYIQLGPSGPVVLVTAVFFMGQSNADGFAADYKTATALSPGYGYEYYYNYGGVGTVLPLGNVRLGRKEGGPQRAFAQSWATGGGGAVVAVDCAAGGSSMSKAYKPTLTGSADLSALSGGTWDLSDPTNLYVNYYRSHMQRALLEMQRQGFSAQRLVVYWSQGEQDVLGVSTQSAYEASFRIFLRQVKIDFPTIWFLIENLGTNQAGSNEVNSAKIRAAQAAVAADMEFSSWVKVCANLAKDFAASGKFSDTLHYNQQGYNELGTAMANSGLIFTGANGTSPAPDGVRHADLLMNMPPVTGWYRALIKITQESVWNVSLFNGQQTPWSHTFYDLTGQNSTDTMQTISWNFGGLVGEKSIMMYLPATAGATLALNAFTGNFSMSSFRVIDEGFPLQQFNVGILEQAAGGAILNDVSLYRFTNAKMRTLGLGSTSGAVGIANGPSFTNRLLSKLPGLTSLQLGRSPNVAADLDLTKVPSLTYYVHSISSLTVAQVNERLVALDTNGLAGGNIALNQYLAGVYPPAAPTGVGATAKANLIAKGWTVATD